MKSLKDLLNPEEEQLYTPMRNELESIPPTTPEPVISDNTPQEQVFTTPKLEDVLPKKEMSDMDQQDEEVAPLLAEATPERPLSRQEQLLQEYLSLSKTDDLKKARETDRMLKMGGAIGDALATMINARSQTKAKIPGVQVQQGAGLGKVAELFQTAPEISSDLAARREALLKQYEALSKSQKSDLTPYQQEMLKLRKEDQRLREKNIEDLNKRFGYNLDLRKSSQQFKEQEKNELSDKQVESMASFDKVQGLSDELKVRAEQFKDVLGPYAANIEQYKSLVPGFQEDPNFAAFRASTTDTLSQYIKSLSGLTVSDKERASLLQSVPTINDKYDIFMSKMEELQKRLDRYKNAELDAAKKYQGKKVPEQKNNEQEDEKMQLSTKDQQALDWANKNPNDPRAIQIKKKLGM
jgi:hypothetical protein